MSHWYIYILRCADNTLYTGITNNLTRRIQEHRAQNYKTAKYLRGRAPLKLVFQLQVSNKSIALRIESNIKKLTKAQKENLIKNKHKSGEEYNSTLLLCR